jgi:hypothetical protein
MSVDAIVRIVPFRFGERFAPDSAPGGARAAFHSGFRSVREWHTVTP